MYGKPLLASIVGGLILLMPQSLAAAGTSLAGSWQFTLTPTTPPIPSVQIPGLATFHADGSAVETDGLEAAPGIGAAAGSVTYATPGHGIWQLMPCRCSYYIQYISVVVNPDGSLNAANTTTMTVALSSSGAQFNGAYTTVQANTSGMTKLIASGAVSGTLIPHPKLP